MQHFMGRDGFYWFFGKVVDRNDPKTLGRVRVRVFGLHPDDETLVPNDHLPWAMPIMPITSAGVFGVGGMPVGVVEGSNVFGFFADGADAQIPFILGTIATGLGHEILSVIDTAKNALAKVTGATAPVQTLGQLSKSFVVKAGPLGQRLMKDLNINDFQAAAILGNLGHESSGVQCDLKEGGSTGPCWAPDTKNKGYGWAQWTNSRLNGFITFVANNFNGYDVTKNRATDDMNYAFLVHELTVGEKTASLTALKKTTNITQATTTFMNVFEKPNSKYAFLDRRLNYANQALASMNGTAVPTRSTGMNINNG
jgi:hypothetical protein